MNLKIPEISFEGIVARHPEAIAALHDAAHDWGLFYLEDTGIPATLPAQILSMSDRFFQLPPELKQQLSLNARNDFRGYVALGEELTNGQPDMKESLEFAREEERPEDAKPQAFDQLYGCNPWPKESWIPGFRSVLERYMNEIQVLGQQLMAALIDSLAIDSVHHDSQWQHPLHFRTRLIHYCQVSNLAKGCIRIAEHTDLALFNLLRIHAPGLEAKHLSGNWFEVNPHPNTLVVILGELCQSWTQGYYRAGIHRVRQATEDGERTSMPFFFYPNLQTTLPTINSNKPLETGNKYAGELLLQRLVGVHPHPEEV